jgi:hypothetical protein
MRRIRSDSLGKEILRAVWYVDWRHPVHEDPDIKNGHSGAIAHGSALGNPIRDQLAPDVGQAKISPLKAMRQLQMVEPKLMQHRGV